MNLSKTLARLRKNQKITQVQVAAYLSANTSKSITFRAVSFWETGVSSPSIEQFLLLCDLYKVEDIGRTFNADEEGYRGFSRLNELGKNRVEEYISLLRTNSLFSDGEFEYDSNLREYIRLYDVSVAAGTGNILDNDSYEDIEVDATIPNGTDFAVRVTGNSMMPRFVDGQIVFVRSQQWIDIGDIGIIALNGDSYIKKLGNQELISLNPMYEPIKLSAHDAIYVFGKVLG